MSKLAACGHTVDLWCANANTVCKTCFEGQRLVYNENSYRDLERGARTQACSGNGAALRGVADSDRLSRMKRECAEIINPVMQLPGTPRHKNDPAMVEARAAAFALIKEKFGIGRGQASAYAKEFRMAA